MEEENDEQEMMRMMMMILQKKNKIFVKMIEKNDATRPARPSNGMKSS